MPSDHKKSLTNPRELFSMWQGYDREEPLATRLFPSLTPSKGSPILNISKESYNTLC